MTITWGTPLRKSDGISEYRLGWEATQSPSTVTASTSSVTITLDLYIHVRFAVNDQESTLSWSGAFGTSSKTVSVTTTNTSGSGWSSANIRKLHTLTRAVSPSYTGAVASSFSISLSGINFIPGTAYVSGSVSTARRPVNPPAAPSGVVVTRKGDREHVVNWTRNSPGDVSAPYERVVVQRWPETVGAYSTVSTLGNVPAFTDTGTWAWNRYRWRVRAENSGGASAWAYSPYVYTTPEAVTAVKAVKQGADILVSWTPPSTPHSGYRLAYRDGDGAIQYPGWSTTATSYRITAPDPAVTHTYYVASTGDALLSPYTASNTVQLQAPPLAPTSLSPYIMDADAATAISWAHNPVDTTDQEAREMRWRLQGTTGWTTSGKVSTASTSITVNPGVWPAGTVEWQVRTWGAHADPSPWSSTTLTTVTRRPSVTITSPEAGEFNGSRATASWTFYDPEGSAQRAARVMLRAEDGTTLWSKTIKGTGTSVAVPYTLQDGVTYVLAVQVQDAPGLWSAEATATLAVVYLPPPTGTIAATWVEETAAVSLEITHRDPTAEEVPVVSCEVWRSVSGGDWVRIAKGLDPTAAILDPAPGVGTVTRYRVVSVSALPSTAEGVAVDVVAPADGWTYLNGGPGLSRVVRVRGATEISMDYANDVEFFDAAGGDGAPLTVTSDVYREVDRVTARLAPTIGGGATWEDLVAFVREVRVPILYRAPTGARRWVAVSDLSGSARRNVRRASFKVTTVANTEPGV